MSEVYATILLLHLLGATIWTGGHIVPVTVLSVLFVVAGVSLRGGWLG